ncbi:MAG: LytTR family DNA-binding domain-containing protein [Bacteroidota bacterium]
MRRPFPDRDFGRSTIMGKAKVSVFVFAVLFFLRPQGIHFSGRNVFLTCLGYGLVTFLVSIAYDYITSKLLGWRRNGDHWTLGRWIMDSGLLLACISIGNFFYYNATVGWTAFHPIVLAGITIPTVIIGLFPIAASGMAIQLRAEREHQRVAGQVQLATAVTTAAKNGRLVDLADSGFSIDPNNLLFCESRQNYVRCVYLAKGEAQEETIRATLSGLEQQLQATTILRCHRSYLVNPNHIRQARGNAQGLRLTLVGIEEEVPVSRAYVAVLRSLMVG